MSEEFTDPAAQPGLELMGGGLTDSPALDQPLDLAQPSLELVPQPTLGQQPGLGSGPIQQPNLDNILYDQLLYIVNQLMLISIVDDY